MNWPEFNSASPFRLEAEFEMNAPPLHVAIVDRHRVFAEALVFRLESEVGIRVVYTGDGEEPGAEKVIAAQPTVLVLDAELPTGSAFDLALDVRRELPGVRILFLTQAVSDLMIDQALRVKADGILLRNEPVSHLVRALRLAADGESTFSPAVAGRLELDPTRREMRLTTERSTSGLTDRQLEILRHLARGESVKDVARKLLLSPKSVDNQKFRIMSKIGVRDKVSLALYAVREGLIVP